MSEDAKNVTLERSDFDATMQKLLAAKRPITKREISAKIRREGHGSSNAAKRLRQQ